MRVDVQSGPRAGFAQCALRLVRAHFLKCHGVRSPGWHFFPKPFPGDRHQRFPCSHGVLVGAYRKHFGAAQCAIVFNPRPAGHLATLVALPQVGQFPHLAQMAVAKYGHGVYIKTSLIRFAHLDPVSPRSASQKCERYKQIFFHLPKFFGEGVGVHRQSTVGWP